MESISIFFGVILLIIVLAIYIATYNCEIELQNINKLLKKQNKIKNSTDTEKILPNLDSKEFYDLMQQYRTAPMQNQVLVCKSYDDVKNWLRTN